MPSTVDTAVANAFRDEWAFVIAATIRLTGDIDLAEECVQEAFSRAIVNWNSNGVPVRPGAWLVTVSRRIAIDVLRRSNRLEKLQPDIARDSMSEELNDGELGNVADDRLRLIFTCCHPALAQEAQVALSLRLLCGLTTSEIARAFLVSESTMAARLTRAKKKIAATHIPYRLPIETDMAERLDAVLDVVHLLFTTGHTAPTGDALIRVDLVDESMRLARMLRSLLPEDDEVVGLLALILLTDARRATRVDANGQLVLLAHQDRDQWDVASIREGNALLRDVVTTDSGRYVLMAALANEHATARVWEETRWTRIISLYDQLLVEWPSSIVALNRAVAIGLAEGPHRGLMELDRLNSDLQLQTYGYYWSSRADFLQKAEEWEASVNAYDRAIDLSDNDVERTFLRRQRDNVLRNDELRKL